MAETKRNVEEKMLVEERNRLEENLNRVFAIRLNELQDRIKIRIDNITNDADKYNTSTWEFRDLRFRDEEIEIKFRKYIFKYLFLKEREASRKGLPIADGEMRRFIEGKMAIQMIKPNLLFAFANEPMLD